MASLIVKLERSGVDEDIEDDIKYGQPESRNCQPSSPNYSILPRGVKDEKPLIGPQNSTGQIKILYPAQIEGYDEDHNSLALMDSLGLPTGFSFGHMEPLDSRQTRGVKKTFYCNTCLIELNSEDTMTSHMKGVRHMKKQLAVEEIQKKLGQPMQQAIVPIANPEPTKKKVPIRLQDKIKETSIPIVGLDFIKEFIAVSDSEMEPHYECSLCDNQGQANGMFSHLNGQKHRQEFTLKKYGNDPSKVKLSQADLLMMAGHHNENLRGFQDRITTRYSDEEYPWPAGKEPWSVLRGGTGIAPDAARNNYGKNQARPVASPPLHSKRESDMKPAAGGSRDKSSTRSILPSADKLIPPKNRSELEKMLQLAQQLMLMTADFSGLKHKDRAVIKSCFAALAVKIEVGGGIKRPRSRSPSRLSTSPPVSRLRTRSPSSAGSGCSASHRRDESSLRSYSCKREKSCDEEERIGNLRNMRGGRVGHLEESSLQIQNDWRNEGRGHKDMDPRERTDSWSSNESSKKRSRGFDDHDRSSRKEKKNRIPRMADLREERDGHSRQEDMMYSGKGYKITPRDRRDSWCSNDSQERRFRRDEFERRPKKDSEERYHREEY